VAHISTSSALAYTTFMDQSKLVVVHECAHRPDADLTVTTLAEAGIKAMIQSDTVGGMRDHLAWSGAGFRILVREEDAADAREVLKPINVGNSLDDTPPDDTVRPPSRH
jgi:hypothetical protein